MIQNEGADISGENEGKINPQRAFFCFLFWEIIFTIMIVPAALVLIAISAGIDFFGAIFLAFLGLYAVVMNLSASLFTAASIAALSAWKSKRVHLLPLLSAIPLYLGLIYWQHLVVPVFSFYSDPPEVVSSMQIFVPILLAGLFVFALVGSWWILKQRQFSQAHVDGWEINN